MARLGPGHVTSLMSPQGTVQIHQTEGLGWGRSGFCEGNSVLWAGLAWASGRCFSEARSLEPALPSASPSEVTVYNQNLERTWLFLNSLSPRCRPVENPGKIMGKEAESWIGSTGYSCLLRGSRVVMEAVHVHVAIMWVA